GKIIELVGRVLNRAGKPMPAARLLIWHANSFGRYTHPNDSHRAPLDPNFIGFAEICADHDGGYRIRTVKPGAYPLESGEMGAPRGEDNVIAPLTPGSHCASSRRSSAGCRPPQSSPARQRDAWPRSRPAAGRTRA